MGLPREQSALLSTTNAKGRRQKDMVESAYTTCTSLSLWSLQENNISRTEAHTSFTLIMSCYTVVSLLPLTLCAVWYW